MTRVRVDFNSRSPEGLVRGSRRRADADFRVGDRVELFDPDEVDMVFYARVVRFDPEAGSAQFEVEWEPVATQLPTLSVARYGQARKRNGHDTWHLCSNCSNWPTSDYTTGAGTGGDKCDECMAKLKDSSCTPG